MATRRFDVVVIGSGAGGGTVTKVLADLGISVLLMEAGPMLNPAKDFKEHMWPYSVPHRGVGPHAEGYFGRTPFTFSASFGGPQIDGEPYTVAPGNEFSWFRSRILGGRTNHYGRISLRYADYGYILENGRVVMNGPAADLATNEDVKEFYLGVASGERKSFRDTKFYKRRKRWLA